MAELNLERPSPAPPATSLETQLQETTLAILGVLLLAAVCQPGILAGAAAQWSWRRLQRPPRFIAPSLAMRIAVAACVAAPAAALLPLIAWAWPVRVGLTHLPASIVASAGAPVPPLTSIAVEALLGPLWFEALQIAHRLRGRSVGVAVVRDHRRDTQRFRALTRSDGAAITGHLTPRPAVDLRHPAGCIRLGTEAGGRTPFDLQLAELAQHVFLPGASGSGKTTTLMRLSDGALAAGYGIVIVDAKGGGLGGIARTLAARYGVPFHLIDPDAITDGVLEPGALGYDPCSGDAAEVGNKLVGAFTYTGAAEVFKDVALEIVPLIVRALTAAGLPVTLKAIYDALGKGGLGALARRVDQPLRGELETLERGGGVGPAGYVGLQRRLGALRQGKFGELLSIQPALDWNEVLAAPAVTYIVLRATASSEDVELMGRLIAQDLKQVCGRRFRQIERNEPLTPVLAIFDEFAALREAEQIVDLLLQARQALMPTVVSVQFLPESIPIRGAVLGAGLVIAHRLAGDDAQVIAQEFGTRRATEVTNQIDVETGYSEKGSVRMVDKFILHPNQLRNLQPGVAAVRSIPSRRNAVVNVIREADG